MFASRRSSSPLRLAPPTLAPASLRSRSSRSASQSSSPPPPSMPHKPRSASEPRRASRCSPAPGSRTPVRPRSTATSAPSRRRPRPASEPSRCNGANHAGDAVTQQAQERPHHRVQHAPPARSPTTAVPTELGGQDAHPRRLRRRHARHHRHVDAQHAGRPERGLHLPGRVAHSSPRRPAASSSSAAERVQRVLAGRAARQRSAPART